MNRLRFLAVCLAFLTFQGCKQAPFTLGLDESAEIDAVLDPGRTQMIEFDAARVTEPGAEVALSVNGVLLPPVYFPPFQPGTSLAANGFASRLWGSDWPLNAHPTLKIVNHGPGIIDLSSLKIQRGDQKKLFRRSIEHAPFPPLGLSDLRDVMAGSYVPIPDDPRAADQISSMKAWGIEQRRRLAFAIIKGLPLPMRLQTPLVENIEIRGCALDAGGAIVAFSRPEAAQWHSIGPGWLPKDAEKRWYPIKNQPAKVKGFAAKGKLFSISIFLGSSATESGGSAAQARLYRIDSVTPMMTETVEGLDSAGKWVEFKFDPPQEPGDYLFELRSLKGSPAWLGWNLESVPIKGTDWTTVVETLNVLEAPASARYDQGINVQALLRGTANQAEIFAGKELESRKFNPIWEGSDIKLEANLFPGQTQIICFRDYEQ